MPEPDFEQIAWHLKTAIEDHPQLSEQNARLIAEKLRLVWNARGAELALLRKYIAFVGGMEGIDYLATPDADEAFTAAELAELRRLAEE